MTNIIAACVTLAWAAGLNATYYDVYKDGTFFTTVYEESLDMCRDGYDWPHDIYVIPFNDEHEQGPGSDHLQMQWVFNHDYDGDGIVGFSDYSLFSKAFTSSDPEFDADEDGTVGFTDYFSFARKFGTYNNGVYEIPYEEYVE